VQKNPKSYIDKLGIVLYTIVESEVLSNRL